MVFPVSKLTKEEKAEISRKNGRKNKTKNNKSCYEKSAPMVIDTDLADMYADIYNPRAKVAPELKIQAATCFMMTGTVTAAAKMCGLDQRLISDWRNHSEWWETVLGKLKKEKQEELDASLTEVIHLSAGSLKDRLINGEEVVTKDGVIKRKLGGRDVATILSTLYDKRSMIRGDPTSITRKESATDVMLQLRNEFEKIAEDVLDKKVINEVEKAS